MIVLDVSKFGNVPALSVGIEFNVDGMQIFKTNGDILLFGSDTSIYSAKVNGSITTVLNGHWDILKAFQNGLVCIKDDFTITINDDLSPITFFEISVTGLKLGN